MSRVTEEKKAICKELNATAWDWQNGEGIQQLIEKIVGMGYDVKARGNVNPVCSCGSWVSPWCGKDTILRNVGKWRFTNFQIRKTPYAKGELDYDNSKEYGEWLRHCC